MLKRCQHLQHFSNISTYFRNVDSSQNNRCQHTHMSETCSNVIKRFQLFSIFTNDFHTCSTKINCFPKLSNGSANGSLKCSLNGSLEGSLNCSLNCSLKCSLKRSLTYSINGQLQLQGSERLLNVCWWGGDGRMMCVTWRMDKRGVAGGRHRLDNGYEVCACAACLLILAITCMVRVPIWCARPDHVADT